MLQQRHILPLCLNTRLRRLISRQQRCQQRVGQQAAEHAQEIARTAFVLIDGEPDAEAELGIVFKQRVRPRGTSTVTIRRIRRRRKVSTENRRTASGVGHDRAIAEELCHQLDVRRFAAASARS